MALTFHYCLREMILKHIDDLLFFPSNFKTQLDYGIPVCIATGWWIAGLAAGLVAHGVVNSTFPVPGAWRDRLFTQCKSSGYSITASFTNFSLLEVGVFSIGYGSYCGIVLQSAVFSGQTWYTATDFFKGFGRLFVVVILAVPFLGAAGMVSADAIGDIHLCFLI